MLDIVVIGDSIAKGVGSSDEATKSFGALIGEKVGGKVTNLGITGLDSGQLIEKLKTEKFQNAVEEADVVFLSIGSNDLLKPFLNIVANAAGVEGEGKDLYKNLQKQFGVLSKKNPLAAGDALANAVKEIKISKELRQGCQQFPEHFETIIEEIKTLNPDVVIYANNIYNPYYGVAYVYEGLTLLNIHELCEGYITELNKAFDRNSDQYTMVDMYSVFQQTGYTNVNPASLTDMSGINFDPHPNDAGYQLMADYIYTHMDSIAPKAELVWETEESGGESVSVQQETIQLRFSEKVRVVEGKELYLSTDKAKYTYTLTGEELLENSSDGAYVLTLKLKDFIGKDTLLYDAAYELAVQENAFKDKGNNTLKETVIGEFTTEVNPKAELQANSVAVVNQSGQNGKSDVDAPYMLMWSVAGIFLVIAVAIVFMVLYNKKRMKKNQEKHEKL